MLSGPCQARLCSLAHHAQPCCSAAVRLWATSMRLLVCGGCCTAGILRAAWRCACQQHDRASENSSGLKAGCCTSMRDDKAGPLLICTHACTDTAGCIGLDTDLVSGVCKRGRTDLHLHGLARLNPGRH